MPNWFVALPVDPGRWFAPLVRTAPSLLRVFHPDDIHVTVAFLGSCGEAGARRAWDRVVAELRHRQPRPMTVTLGEIVPMGNPKRPSALSVVIAEGAAPVAELIGALRPEAWSAADARPDDRPPRPHITVARPRRKASGAERKAAIRWATDQPPVKADVTLDRVALLTWAEDRRARQFRAVEQSLLPPATSSATPAGSAPETPG